MHRVRGLALACITAGVLLVSAAYGATWAKWRPDLAVWAMILGIALQLGGITVLGGTRAGRRNAYVIIAALFLGAVVVLGFGAAIVLPPETAATSSYLLGLPRRAAIVLLGIGILPFLVLPFLYAADFDANGLDEASLAQLREECQRVRDARARGEGR